MSTKKRKPSRATKRYQREAIARRTGQSARGQRAWERALGRLIAGNWRPLGQLR